MANEDFPSFSSDKVEQAIAAARQHSEALQAADSGKAMGLADGGLKLRAECISLKVKSGQVCVSLPLGLGSACLPIPGWIPEGTAAQACLDICTKWGVPCGVEVTVSVAGQQIVQKGFGCSC